MVAMRESLPFQAQMFAEEPDDCSAEQAEAQELYREVLRRLRRRASLFMCQGFLEPLVPIKIFDNVISLRSPSAFHRDWVNDHYARELRDTLTEVVGREFKAQVLFEGRDTPPQAPKRNRYPKVSLNLPLPKYQAPEPVREETVTPAVRPALEALRPVQESFRPVLAPLRQAPIMPLRAPAADVSSTSIGLESCPLNPKYCFDTFIPGPSNQIGFTACNAVSEHPGAHYSPLFLFGSVGIGKTHLVHAIGLEAKKRNPSVRILYLSAEQWVNAYIQAVRDRKFDAFRRKFRSDCDMLLIDDIQFLAGKDASQDEFFHTFNALHQAHKQIVVTSDKYPHEIEGLEQRLQTRLAWGLIADVRPPELETRIAILHKKAQASQIPLPDDVAYYMASQITSSVRELEGALLRMSAFLSMTKTEISLDAVKENLSPMLRRSATNVLSPDRICEQVARCYDLTSVELKGQSRQRQVVLARQIAMALCRVRLALSLPEIGRFFGGRDHSTVISSIRKIEQLSQKDTSLKSMMAKIESNLENVV